MAYLTRYVVLGDGFLYPVVRSLFVASSSQPSIFYCLFLPTVSHVSSFNISQSAEPYRHTKVVFSLPLLLTLLAADVVLKATPCI
jgi:formate hydrogenlyase subunit 4